MSNPTRQDMLDTITHKIARTGGGTGPGETGYYEPVMIEDCDKLGGSIPLDELWGRFDSPLYEQSDDCISYIYNLINHE